MKIGMISPTYTPSLNGISISLQKLVEKLREEGHEVYVAIPPVFGAEYPDYIIKLPVFPLSRIFKSVLQDVSMPFNFRKTALEAFRQKGIEVIHSHDTGIMFWASEEISKELKIPHVHTYHTFMEEYVQALHPFGYRKLARHMTENACSKATTVITPTEKMREYLLSLGVSSKIVTLLNIPNLDHIQIKPKNEVLMNKLGIKKNDFVFISFGRVVPQKNISKSISLLEPILKSNENVKFIISGFGSEEESLKSYSQELGLKDKVIFTGKFNVEDLCDLGSISDCFVITSTSETQCITILEAMKMGLPVVAVNDSAYKYVLENGVNGFFVPESEFANSCLKIFKDRDIYTQMSKNAISSAESLNNKNWVEDYLKIYQEAIERYKLSN